MYSAHPLQINRQGRTATVSREEYVRQMIEQVLFTVPGERVNRPDYGCGLLQLVFAAPGSELVAATQSLVQGSLQRWLGEWIDVESVQVTSEDETLRILVQYILKATGERRREHFERGVASS